jgi:hypothetical protein
MEEDAKSQYEPDKMINFQNIMRADKGNILG